MKSSDFSNLGKTDFSERCCAGCVFCDEAELDECFTRSEIVDILEEIDSMPAGTASTCCQYRCLLDGIWAIFHTNRVLSTDRYLGVLSVEAQGVRLIDNKTPCPISTITEDARDRLMVFADGIRDLGLCGLADLLDTVAGYGRARKRHEAGIQNLRERQISYLSKATTARKEVLEILRYYMIITVEELASRRQTYPYLLAGVDPPSRIERSRQMVFWTQKFIDEMAELDLVRRVASHANSTLWEMPPSVASLLAGSVGLDLGLRDFKNFIFRTAEEELADFDDEELDALDHALHRVL